MCLNILIEGEGFMCKVMSASMLIIISLSSLCLGWSCPPPHPSPHFQWPARLSSGPKWHQTLVMHPPVTEHGLKTPSTMPPLSKSANYKNLTRGILSEQLWRFGPSNAFGLCITTRLVTICPKCWTLNKVSTKWLSLKQSASLSKSTMSQFEAALFMMLPIHS
jgi:hypothetical protein